MLSRTLFVLVVLANAVLAADLVAFRQWAAHHGKTYTKAEELRRLSIWASNMAEVEKLNAETKTARFTLGKFADLTNSEFRATFLGLRPDNSNGFVGKDDIIPDDVDRDLDMSSWLPEVKNQGNCGSCWAFSAVANMEGRTYMKNGGEVVSLSEQQIVTCDISKSSGYPYACNGGQMYQADEYILEIGGITSEEEFPYVGFGGDKTKCNHTKVVAKFDSQINWGKVVNDSAIIEYLEQHGPLSVGIEGGAIVFQHYKGGVLDNKGRCGHTLDHGVTLVGYGTDSDTGLKYWKIRNSWGPDWGEEGYARMSRGKNMCAINGQLSTII